MKICLTVSEVSLVILVVLFGLSFFFPELMMPGQFGLFLLIGLGSFLSLKWLDSKQEES